MSTKRLFQSSEGFNEFSPEFLCWAPSWTPRSHRELSTCVVGSFQLNNDIKTQRKGNMFWEHLFVGPDSNYLLVPILHCWVLARLQL